MNRKMKHSLIQLTYITSALFSAGWSTNSMACAFDPYLSSVCVMALTGDQINGFGNGTYVPANGQLISVQNNATLFSLIGSTYGGDGKTFALPNLQGRVVLGAGASDYGVNYSVGQKGGSPTVTLLTGNLPAHTHKLTTEAGGVVVNAAIGTMSVNVGLGSLAATTSLSTVTGSANGSGLTLNASTGGNTTTAPSGASLATTAPSTKIYSDAAPMIGMKAGSITGVAPVSFTGNPTTTLSGTPAASLTGTPSVTVNGVTGGVTGGVGTIAPVSVLPPYMAMKYFIAIGGNSLYPHSR